MGSACVYGQVLKTRRHNRVVRVERRVKICTASRLQTALLTSEDFETLNTSFVERLNLTIRQGSAYLRRRSLGRETRTPAMQAGVVSARMSWSNIFAAPASLCVRREAVVRISVTVQLVYTGAADLPLAAARTKGSGLINSERRKHRIAPVAPPPCW